MVMRENNETYARDIAWLQHEMLQCGQLAQDEADDWNDPSQDGSLAALFEVVEDGDHDKAKAVLNSTCAKQHINVLGPEGDTLLHLACLYAHEECAQLLLANGADVTVVDEDSSTVLHDAAAGGSIEILRMILDKDPALVSAVDADGDTPLHNAARGGWTEIVETLILEGASPLVKNKLGETPRHTCETNEVEAGVKEALLIAERGLASDPAADAP
eukprot:jgi/Ulvmu1/7211/UM034_0120.1